MSPVTTEIAISLVACHQPLLGFLSAQWYIISHSCYILYFQVLNTNMLCISNYSLTWVLYCVQYNTITFTELGLKLHMRCCIPSQPPISSSTMSGQTSAEGTLGAGQC